MKEILLTSSVLILALLALRQLFRRTVSRRMQYALWLLVLVRLLVPVNVGTLAHNVLSAAAPVQAVVEERLDTPVLYVQDGTERRPAQLLPGKESQGEPLSPPSDAAQSAPADEYYTVTPTYRTVTLSEALTYVWYAGMAGVGAWFLFTNLRFARALRRTRMPYRVEGCRYPVYLVSALPSPCLFGVLRPTVYLNEKALQSPDALRFVLAHEQTHARHFDPLWSLLRGVCLTVYWFDPLVWLAAVLSREDGELACDEGTLRALGADERTAYGKALLALVPVCDKPQNPLLGATTMTSGKRGLKERITRIAENRQAKAVAVFAAVALAALVCAVSFTGAPDTTPEVTQEWYDAGFTTEDAQACLEFLDWAAELDGSKITGCGAWDAETSAAHFLLEEPSDDTSAQIEALEGILRSVRAEELTPFAARDGEVRYTLTFNDDYTGYYGFSLSENGQVVLDAPAEYETEGTKLRALQNRDRFEHTYNVVLAGLEIARKTNLDESEVFVACLLHDCAKNIPCSEWRRYGFDNGENLLPPIVHCGLGVKVAERVFGITDARILDAIRFHTTCRPEMTQLDKLVFVADKVELTRNYPELKENYSLALSDLDAAFLTVLSQTYRLACKKHGAENVDEMTRRAMNYYFCNTKQEK